MGMAEMKPGSKLPSFGVITARNETVRSVRPSVRPRARPSIRLGGPIRLKERDRTPRRPRLPAETGVPSHYDSSPDPTAKYFVASLFIATFPKKSLLHRKRYHYCPRTRACPSREGEDADGQQHESFVRTSAIIVQGFLDDDDDDDTREVSARTRTLLKRGVRRSAVAHQRPNAWL